MKDKEFLYWIHARLVNQYKENPNTDFMLKLQAIATETDANKDTKWYV